MFIYKSMLICYNKNKFFYCLTFIEFFGLICCCNGKIHHFVMFMCMRAATNTFLEIKKSKMSLILAS